MIGATEKIGKNNLNANKLLVRPKIVCLRNSEKRLAIFLLGYQVMTAFIFILIYYLGKPVFVSFGVTDRNRFFTALALGLIFETIVFSITGTTGYKLVGS